MRDAEGFEEVLAAFADQDPLDIKAARDRPLGTPDPCQAGQLPLVYPRPVLLRRPSNTQAKWSGKSRPLQAKASSAFVTPLS